jgi:Mce-associated membrane protein
VISDARTRPPVEDDDLSATDAQGAGEKAGEKADEAAAEAPTPRRGGRAGEDTGTPGGRSRPTLPVVPVLGGLLVLLLAAVGFLWSTRPAPSAVRTADYAAALQAARSGIVDYTSFDYLTLDDDIEQIRRIATGDLREEGVARLDERRQALTDSAAVASTEIIGAGVTRADADDATVMLVIQTTRKTNASEQAQIVKYRIQVELQKSDGRWLLSGITGR